MEEYILASVSQFDQVSCCVLNLEYWISTETVFTYNFNDSFWNFTDKQLKCFEHSLWTMTIENISINKQERSDPMCLDRLQWLLSCKGTIFPFHSRRRSNSFWVIRMQTLFFLTITISWLVYYQFSHGYRRGCLFHLC